MAGARRPGRAVVEGVLSSAARLFPLGAIAGDVIGSVHERAGTKTTDFPLFTPASCFTDDCVLTAAVAEVLASGGNYTDSIQRWARTYPRAGYALGGDAGALA